VASTRRVTSVALAEFDIDGSVLKPGAALTERAPEPSYCARVGL
jgi:hypothetical protein